MSFHRQVKSGRAATLVGTLLMTTAFVVPALAQIETVVVTAEKRVEDIQTVPISVTAYTAADLAAHQVNEFKDLQFSTPNVSYTKGNFTGSNFQIRGIGITAVGYDAESGVAVNVDDVFLVNPPLAEANFYDLERIEVLRGPQSTLYGRGATGGVLNVQTAKPDLDSYGADVEGSYGNYNASELKGMVNIPLITDVAAIRFAGDWVRHDGYVTNIADNSHINSEDTYSLRGSLRFKPSEDTTIDISGSYSHEADSKMRSPKQLCTTDPTGVLGCLPDSATTGVVNLNSTLATIASSRQGLGGLGATVGGNLVTAGAIPSSALPAFIGAFQNMGLFDLSVAPTLPAPLNVLNPTDLRKVNTDFAPIYHAHDDFVALNVKQRVTDWLEASFVGGYDYHATFSQESYNNVAGQPINPTTLATAEATFLGVMQELTGSTAYGNNYLPYFSVPGALPVSGVGGLGLTSGNIDKFSNVVTASDQSDGYSQQYSGELRFNTNFEGPLNFMLAGYYLRATGRGDYYVTANTFDYPFMIVGATVGAVTPGLSPPNGACANGCVSPGYYHNDGTFNGLTSKAVFGEVYYDLIPDTLKLTAGARFTEDQKNQIGRIFIFPGPVPIGTPSEAAAVQFLQAIGEGDFDASQGGPQSYQVNSVTYDKWTGRAVVDWTPKLDFTDQTLVYASYARGYKAGGFNPGIQPGLGIQPNYNPESIDAYELGTKNTLLDGTLQANLTGFYYNYDSLQVSAIVANTSVNQNISAKIWGVEGELLYQPVQNLTLNFNFGHLDTSIGNSSLIDQRNPSGGRSDVVLIKDDTLGASVSQNCVIYMTAAAGGVTPADNMAFLAAAVANGAGGIFFAPPGGSSALAGHGVPHVNYGTCNPALAGLFGAFGYSLTDPTGANNASDGVAVNLSGNQLQNAPPWTLSAGIQYKFDLNNGYSITPRAEISWQTAMWGRIFDTPADRIGSQENTNALITFTAPDDNWYVQGYIKNVFNEDNIAGEYLTSASSGLYTNAFLNDPRLFGVKVGAHF